MTLEKWNAMSEAERRRYAEQLAEQLIEGVLGRPLSPEADPRKRPS
jgi:hypothetical protein